MRSRLNLPQPLVPVFWGLLLLEATFGAYLSVWPLWIERLGAPIAVVGFVLGVGGVLRMFVLAPSAAIAERFGFRITIIVARSIAVIALLGAAVSTHWAQLLLVVVGLAIGEMVFPLIQTIVAAEAGDQRMRSFALVFNVGPSIALAISPLIGAGMVALLGMQSAFVLGAIFSFVSLLCFTRVVDPAARDATAQQTPATYRTAAREPSFLLVAGMLLITIFSLSFGVAFIPTFLEDVHGFSPSEIAALSALPAIGSAIFGLGVARTRSLQHQPFIATAIPVGLMAVAFMILQATALLPLLALAFLLRGGLFASWATLVSALGELAPVRLRARSFALLEMVGGLAFSLGPIFAGLVYSRRETLPFMIATLFSLALVPLFILAQRKANGMPRAQEISVPPPSDPAAERIGIEPAVAKPAL